MFSHNTLIMCIAQTAVYWPNLTLTACHCCVGSFSCLVCLWCVTVVIAVSLCFGGYCAPPFFGGGGWKVFFFQQVPLFSSFVIYSDLHPVWSFCFLCQKFAKIFVANFSALLWTSLLHLVWKFGRQHFQNVCIHFIFQSHYKLSQGVGGMYFIQIILNLRWEATATQPA